MSNGNGQSNGNTPSATSTTIKPTDLRGILKYVPRFQGQIFVLALDGAVVADENFANLLVDIAVLRSLGIKVVLVHGIGHQLVELSQLRNIPISNVHGTGVTDAATLDLAVRASSRVAHSLVEALTQNSLKCVVTNAVRALPTGIIKGVDQQFTGKVDRIDKDFILELIDRQIVPIVSPIGFGPDGKSLRFKLRLRSASDSRIVSSTDTGSTGCPSAATTVISTPGMRTSKYDMADPLMNRSSTRSPGAKRPVQFAAGGCPFIR